MSQLTLYRIRQPGLKTYIVQSESVDEGNSSAVRYITQYGFIMSVQELVNEVESTHGTTFWYGSQLLKKCEENGDPAVVQMLSIRHHCLQNKEAGSCQVIRQTIKNIEGPYFPTLWDMFDNDEENVELGISNHYSDRWAAGYILGEIGGCQSLLKFSDRLQNQYSHIHYAVIRCISHIVSRYFQISENEEPTMTSVDVKTGKQQKQPLKDVAPDLYLRALNDRKQANEYFTNVDSSEVSLLKERLSKIESNFFNYDKSEFIQMLDYLPK